MKILFVNTYHSVGGGDRTYMFNMAELLKKNGHQIAFFAMNNKNNIYSPWEKYFIDEINFLDINKKKTIKGSIEVLARSVYSLTAKKLIEKLIIDFYPDIVWLQTIHNHISPSIIHTLKKYNIPIIWTLHTYTAICVNSTFTREGKICEVCKPNRFYKSIFRRCKKGSILASMVGAIAAYFHNLLGLYLLVDSYISPSKFLRDKFIEFGMPPNKIIHIPNFINTDEIVPNFSGEYGLFFGRLSSEKGIMTLLTSLKYNREIPFKIVGDGPYSKELKNFALKNNIQNVEFTGFKTGLELKRIVMNAKFVVVPSEWYENQPYSVIEAFSFGKPVVGTNVGGIAEIIEDGENGFLIDQKNYSQLSEKINLLYRQSELCKTMGKKARKDAEIKYNSDIHFNQIFELISSLTG